MKQRLLTVLFAMALLIMQTQISFAFMAGGPGTCGTAGCTDMNGETCDNPRFERTRLHLYDAEKNLCLTEDYSSAVHFALFILIGGAAMVLGVTIYAFHLIARALHKKKALAAHKNTDLLQKEPTA